MAAHVVKQQGELLTSWKEIASYLGKGIRTVQRWEQQFGLPVRRPNEKTKGIVHATREELDQWLAMQWSQRPKPSASSVSASVDEERLAQVRMALQTSAELRRANQLLLEGVRSSIQSMFAECQVLTRRLGEFPPQKVAVIPARTDA